MINALKFTNRNTFRDADDYVLLRLFMRAMLSASCKMNGHISFLKNLFEDAVKAVQPAELIKNQIKYSNGHLSVNNQTYPTAKAYYAVGFGKAVLGMALELEKTLGTRLERAIVTVPRGIFEKYPESLGKRSTVRFIQGAENNIPDRDAEQGAEEIKELVEGLGEEDLLFVLISGGGSALLPLPKPPITLEEKQDIIKSLSRSGASIQELNTVRKQLSLLKGGGLAHLAYPARVVSLILSDVVGDPLDIIASGPTVYWEEDSQVAIEILKKYDLYGVAPNSVKEILNNSINRNKQSQFADVCKGKFTHVHNVLIGTNRIATDAAKLLAEQQDVQCVVISHKVEGDVNMLAEIYAQLAWCFSKQKKCQIKALLEKIPFDLEEGAIDEVLRLDGSKKTLFIFAGEPTVHVTGSGKGGRNQQLALAFCLELNKYMVPSTAKPGNISLLSAGTDGIDGPTDAAGAVGCIGLAATCSHLGIKPETYLRSHDSYSFFSEFLDGGCLIKIGHTGTNVMDLHFLFVEPCLEGNIR
ncbi:glycerate kinase [Euwallacea similis]|uniref:glycerate kinase n=1 Tax=Euwallacea similis TaxID=1736056 RepID=UPI00344D05F4